jgi:hypothetical protein
MQFKKSIITMLDHKLIFGQIITIGELSKIFKVGNKATIIQAALRLFQEVFIGDNLCKYQLNI